jgi:hypothetical protein
MKPYKIVNNEAIQLIEGPYMGITYQYGRVLLNPDEKEDVLKLSFSYNILSGDHPSDQTDFESYIGGLLHEMIEERLAQNDIVYTGGV